MKHLFDVIRVRSRRARQLLRIKALGSIVFLAGACSNGAAPTEPLVGVASIGRALTAASAAGEVATPVDGGSAADGGPTAMPIAVPTRSGVVVGQSNGATASFLGIPYAAPPVGALRWRAPLPPAPWLEPRDASAFGSPCPQSASSAAPSGSVDEDCLTLNVWASSARHGLAPVMVFIHGGGFFSGGSSDPQFDGSALAERGVVVVTMNYRLGQLGYLAHPALVAEDRIHHSAGNYGVLDQQLALRWVQANIAAFGGDPENVTLWGQSAGAISVCTHLVVPSSAGLFQQVIQESGSCSVVNPLHDTPGVPYESAESLGRAFAAALGCDTASDVAACMRAKAVADVLSAAPRNPLDGLLTTAHYEPNIDGSIIPAPTWALLQTGHLNSRTWLGGANHDEGILLAELRVQLLPIATEADYETVVGAIAPGFTSNILALYPPAAFGSPAAAYAFLVTDLYTCTMRRQAQWMAAHHSRAYLYQFSRVNGFGAEFGIGALHGTELPYIFGKFIPPFTEDATDLSVSDFMMGAWTQFAAEGNPSLSRPEWTHYRTAVDNFMQVADTVSLQTGLNAQRCDALSTIGDQIARDEAQALEQ